MTDNTADATKGTPFSQRMMDQMGIANLSETTQIIYNCEF